MLQDVIKTFKKQYDEKGERYITDSYILLDGEYVIIDILENNFEVLDKVIVKKDKKDNKFDRSNQFFEFLQKADYMSMYLNSDKALSDKNIHSNNYLSFFVKKENVNNGKLNNEVIDKYYEILKNPLIKYKKPKAKKLYKELEEIYGQSDEKLIDEIKSWIKNNIYDLVEKNSKENTYLKIFFKYDLDKYYRESQKYILANIYNKNDYNTTINEKIYGLSNDNMGLNSKKPYLENKTRKSKLPYLLSREDVLMQKKFFDYLSNQVSIGKTNIYIDDENIEPKSDQESIDRDFNGIYLRIKKGKEVEIHDFDTINNYKANIRPIVLRNITEVDLNKSELNYNVKIKTLKEIRNLINQVFFSKLLTSNYFTDSKDMGINDNNLIKGSINNGYIFKAGEQFNLRCALKEYFVGGENMADILVDVKASLRDKICQSGTPSIENDKEYYFAVGQLTSYFISLNKSSKKVHSLANPIINAKNDERIKMEFTKMFKKYNYTISRGRKRFDNLMAMISSYVPESKVNEDLIIAGYLHSNLIFEKEESENEK